MWRAVSLTRSRTMILGLLLVLTIVGDANCAPRRRTHHGTLRLCSRSLSDALFLICRDRGYNEPFSYSGEDEPRGPPGPGLVEECCYHSCTYDQLEQYCKPSSEEKRSDSTDIIDEYSIVNLPYSSERRKLSSEEDLRSGDEHGTRKRSVGDSHS